MRAGRGLVLAFVASLLATGVAFADESVTHPERDVPWFLPRSASLNLWFNGGAIVPQARVMWEVKLIEQGHDLLAAGLEGGGGYGLALPDDAGPFLNSRMTYFYEHTAMLGILYRGRRLRNLRIGAEFFTGPLFYGARFSNLPTDNRITGIIEGRLRLGIDAGPMTLGIHGGYASLYEIPIRSNAAPFAGGLVIGAFVDWWH